MTLKEKRVKIAEVFGYKFVPSHDSQEVAVPEYYESPDGERLWDINELPNFFEDLNAMHDAEKLLRTPEASNKLLWTIYLNNLARICKTAWASNTWLIPHASASQKAEAFGLALKLWTD